MRSLLILSSTLFAAAAVAQGNQPVFTDTLGAGWANWSWATVALTNTSPVHGGSKSIKVTAAAWEALYLHQNAADSSAFTNLSFWIHGGASGGQRLRVVGLLSDAPANAVDLPVLTANAWQAITVSLAALGCANQPNFSGFYVQDRSGTAQPAFYVDDIQLLGAPPPPNPGGTNVLLSIDAAAGRHPIDPLIYGVAWAGSNDLRNLNATLNRWGGNAVTRHNWQLNARQTASDYYFESIGSGSSIPGAEGDAFVARSRQGGAAATITVPMIGWVAKLGPGLTKLASFSIAKYGAQTDHDVWFPDAGNGISSATGQRLTGNDPNDANQPADTNFIRGWIQHFTNRWGTAATSGVRFYHLDNEPAIWWETHRDVTPNGVTMDDLRDRSVACADVIKSVDPGALVLGPEEYGWSGFLYSGADIQWAQAHGYPAVSTYPDRAAHGGADFLPWYLAQFRQRSVAAGRRLLDYCAVHYYPQGGEFSADVSTAMQLLRNRSTRSLWDTNYVDASWINDRVFLIPRLKQWVAGNYPGTRVALTEYNWGAENHINGATAQADILGILGREGCDLAERWEVPPAGPVFKAFQMYRNYDGNRSTFGDVSVTGTTPNPDALAIFGALRSTDGALTVMLVNKVLAGTTNAILTLTNFAPSGLAQVWRLTAANAITRLADVPFSASRLTNSLPAQSITLLILPATKPRLDAEPGADEDQINLRLFGDPGQTYVLQGSTNLIAWTPFATNRLTSNGMVFPVPTISWSTRLFRAVGSP